MTAAMCRHALEAIFNPFFIGLALFTFLLVWLCATSGSFIKYKRCMA